MSKHGERLQILAEHGSVLLQRMYLVKKDLETPERIDMVKTANVLYKKLNLETLEFPDNIEKQSGFDSWFKPKLNAILKATTPIFCTFREYVDWCEVARQELEEIGASVIELSFDQNMAFVSDYLDTLVSYSKLAILSDRIAEKRAAIGLYNLAYMKTNGRAESFTPKIAAFFKSFAPKGLLGSLTDTTLIATLKTLRASLYKINQTVGKCIIHAILTYDKGTMEFMQFKRPLELLSDPEKIPYPASEDSYFELTYHQQVIDWVTWGYLCCPESLGTYLNDTLKGRNKINRGILFLQQILSQGWISTIYGDETCMIHELYDDVFYRFKGQTINLQNEKKTLKTASDASFTTGPRLHYKRRTYFRMQLRALHKMLLDFPGLISPKFQLVLGCLHLTKGEIMWYFTHFGAKPKNAKQYKEIGEPYIGELIYLMDEVSSICLARKQEISDYHLEFLRKVYTKKVTGLVEQVKDKFDGSIKTLLLSFQDDIANATNFAPFRLNFKRLEILLSSYQYKTTVKETAFQNLLQTLNTCFHISKHVDDIEGQVYHHGILKELYFYEPIVVKLFTTALTAFDTSPLYSHSYLRLINYFQHIAHPSNFEYRSHIGSGSVNTALKMLNSLITSIEKGINELKGPIGFEQLLNQIGGDKVAYRLKCKAERVKEPAIPGEESMFDEDYVQKMRLIESNLTKLLFSLNSYPEIVVFDTIFYPSEFLREKLELFIQKHVLESSNGIVDHDIELKKLRQKDIKQLKFVAPSILEEKLANFMFALKVVEQCININIEELVLSAFLENFVHLNYVEGTYSFTVTGEPENTVVNYAKWYVDMIADGPKLKFLYVPVRKCFVTTKESSPLSYKIQEYVDFQELMALTRLIGPYGVRTFDQIFIVKINTILELLKEQLAVHKNSIKEITGNIWQDRIFDNFKGKFKNIDKYFDLLIQLGGLLTFRTHIREALEISIQSTIEPVYNIINDTLNQYPKNVYKDEKLMPIDALALDCGINPEGVDNGIKKITTYSDLWEILPYSFACLMFSGSWSSTEYNVHLEGWSNNSHLAIHAINSLMVSIFGNNKQTLNAEFSKFAELSAALLLNQKQDKLAENCYIFTDKIVKSTEFYEYSSWEELCPYSLTKHMYSRAYTRGALEDAKKKE